MKKEVTKEKALERLEGLCSRSEQCEFDLNRKMINWGLSSANRKEIMESLRDNRYVDDSRFARSFTNDKARFSSWGPNKIRMELIKRRLPSSIITESLRNVEPEVWKEGLLKNALSKAKNLDLTGEEGWKNRQKLFRYIVGRGFPSSSASKAVNLMKKRQEEASDD
ncbi:MAG: RecX family transcriptional regulator [Muribaculaceae bacterium]|nr:RecX family transcriptional regulator [Muribaculaceae bacterium]